MNLRWAFLYNPRDRSFANPTMHVIPPMTGSTLARPRDLERGKDYSEVPSRDTTHRLSGASIQGL